MIHNRTVATTIPQLTARWRAGVADGTLRAGLWQDEEHACALAMAGPGVTNEGDECLAFIGPLWMRELIYMAFDGVADDERDAMVLRLADAMDAWAVRGDYLETAESLRHRFASEIVLPRALMHFDHDGWPDVRNAIDAKIALHRRWLSGDEPETDEWRDAERRAEEAKRAARAAWAAEVAWAAAAAGAEAAAAWTAGAAEWSVLIDGFIALLHEMAGEPGK